MTDEDLSFILIKYGNPTSMEFYEKVEFEILKIAFCRLAGIKRTPFTKSSLILFFYLRRPRELTDILFGWPIYTLIESIIEYHAEHR